MIYFYSALEAVGDWTILALPLELWIAAGLMILLRCGPILLPAASIARYAQALTIASRIAIGLALLSALLRLMSLGTDAIAAGLGFAGSGLTIFIIFRSLPAALIGAALVYASARLIF